MDDLSIAFKLNDQVITFWQFYIAWIAGVVGWVFSREHGWRLAKRLAVGVGVTIFNIFNISGLLKTSTSLATVISTMGADNYPLPVTVTRPVFEAALCRLDTGPWYYHIGPHILADLLVMYFIFIVAKHNPVANKASQ